MSKGGDVQLSEELIKRRLDWELNPVFPPEDSAEEIKAKWRVMEPAEKRKMLMLHELDAFTAVSTVSVFYCPHVDLLTSLLS